MPKLLIVTTVPIMMRGFLLPFARHFKDLGWQVDAMMSPAAPPENRWDECEEIFDKIWPINWTRSPFSPSNYTKAPKQVREAVSQGKYDLVHVHSPIASFVTRYALKDLPNRPKLIYTTHGFHFHKGANPVINEVYKRLERIAGPWTDKLVVINHEDEQAAKRLNIVPDDHILYMPGIGVEVEKYRAAHVTKTDTDAIYNELGLKETDKLILMIAEFNPGKRHRDALNALKATGRKDLIYAFAGVGPLEEDVQDQAESLGLTGQIKMLGYRRDIPVLLKASNALLLPSEREGLPRSVLEAMCAATPVISTEIRGVEDLLADNCGLMTKVGDVEAIAKALIWVADHPTEARELGLRGQEKMKLFSLDNVIKMHEDLYGELL